MKQAFHIGKGPAFKIGPKAHGPAGGLNIAPPLPTNPAMAAPTPPPASPPSPAGGSGGGGLQALMADAKQAAAGG